MKNKRKKNHADSSRYLSLISSSIFNTSVSSISSIISSHGSSSSSMLILNLVSPTISTPNSFSMSKVTILFLVSAFVTVGCFKVLTMISVSLVSSAFSLILILNTSLYSIFLLITAVFESFS